MMPRRSSRLMPVIFLVFFGLLAACGGGGGGVHGETSKAKAIPVQIDGDSLSFRAMLAHSVPSRLQEWRPSWTVTDRGVSGLTLKNLVSGYTEPFTGAPTSEFPRGPQQPYSTNPKSGRIVVLALGVNDALEMRSVADFDADLRLAIRILHAEMRTPVLTGLVDMPVSDVFHQDRKTRRDELNQVTLRVAVELGLQHAGWGEDYRGPHDIFDSVHRTQEASDRLAVLLMQAIERAD